VQTPHRYFPIESHSWLPFLSYLPRGMQVHVMRATNRFWIMKTSPDWNLLGGVEMQGLSPDARIVYEFSMGLRKSVIAIMASTV
jgi:hypothetical protein